MQGRRDQVQAYAFATSRLATALTTGKTGNGEAPFQRAMVGALVGIVAAVLVGAGAFIYGLIRPATVEAWRQPGSVVVVKETGTRFVYLGGVLHPTANYTSTALIAGSARAVSYVPQKALTGIPVGPMIGIPGAPQTLPAPSALLSGTWAVCLPPGAPGTTVLDLAPNSHATAPVTGRKILLVGPDGRGYVLWNGEKYQVTSRSSLITLGLGNQVPIRAPAAWLADVPAGPALVPAAIPGAGTPGAPVGGQPATIGTVFSTTAAGADQYYVLLEDGLAPVSQTEAALITAGGSQPAAARQVSIAAIAAAPASADRSLLSGVPDMVSAPAYTPGSAALCVRQQSPGHLTGDSVITDQAAAGSAPVIVPPGAGMIAAQQAATPNGTATYYLIADTGQKYLLADSNAVSNLGYGNGSQTPPVLPPAVLAAIPSGPALSTAAAEQPVPSG
jgi:ESX secretion system ATPase EccB